MSSDEKIVDSIGYRLFRRIWTKPVWLWERNRPYPIREKIWKHPSIPVQGKANSLGILTTPRHAEEVAWCAASILKVLKNPIGLKIIVDGEWNANAMDKLSKLFPGVDLRKSSEFVERYALQYPALHRLAMIHPMGRKMLVVLGLQEESDVIYGDDDLLAFAPMPEVDDWLQSSSANIYLQDVSTLCYEPTLHQIVQQKKIPFAETINVGFMLIRKGSFDGKIADTVLADAGAINTWFPDTTLISVLMGNKGIPLTRERYIVSAARQFYGELDIDYSKISLRHFTQPVRHLMYLKGMPLLWNRWSV